MSIKSIIILAATIFAFAGSACGNTKPDNSPASADKAATQQSQPMPDGAVAFSYSTHLYFNVVLRDSIPARMVFDTGNTSILLDEAFYKKHFAHLGSLRKAMAAGAGNAMQAVNLDMSGWKYSVGKHSQTEQRAVVMDLRKILRK